MVNNHSLNSQKRVVVIGAGIGGIASALRVRALGYQVVLIERLPTVGGRAQVFEKNGYLHDAGPTLITAPFLFNELFELFDEKREDYLEFKAINPWYRFYFHTGETFDYCDTIEATHAEINKFNPKDVKNYDRLLKFSEAIFDIGFTKLADTAFLKFSNMIRQFPNIIRLKGYRTVFKFVSHYLEHPLLRRAFSIHPLLVGGNPFDTTSIYSLIHFLERKWGVYFCMGGTGKLIKELHNLMLRNGIELELMTDIDSIEVKDKKVRSITSKSGKRFEAETFIFNSDPPTVYRELMPKRHRKNKKFLPECLTSYSMGLFVLFFGTKIQYADMAHHTIWMGKRYKSLLNDIFNKKILADDFSLYIHRPTATDVSFAPKGHDSFYVLCPVPNLLGNIDWDIEGPRLRDRIIKALESTIMPNLSKVYEDDFFMTPEDFATNYRTMHGTGFSIARSLTQSAWFRYHNQDPDLSNLYFSGAGTHPGAGMPGVLCSAKVVENLMKRNWK